MESKLDIPLSGDSFNIVRQCGAALSDVLQSKFGCLAIIEGVESSPPAFAQQRSPAVVKEKRFGVVLRSGVQVSVWKADLTMFQVDAVVNAANARLQHYGGLAQALLRAGGPQIQTKSDDYIFKNGPLATGDAIVTDAGSLSCQKIIHAVGPSLPFRPTTSDVYAAEPLLKQAIKSILDRVKEHRLQSVAIPAISSGLFNYPLAQCANIIVAAVKGYYENSSGHPPKEIMLVNNDEPSVREMERACRQLLAPHMTHTRSQAAASTSKHSGDAKSATPSVRIGKVLLTLKKGKLEDQQTDVIVNTASQGRDLSFGEVSKALLEKAGQKMQKEMRTAIRKGHIVSTESYNLPCKNVYHTFCPDKGTFDADKILSDSVLECLWMAGANSHQSISFPAIGTGLLGFLKRDTARIMTYAVADFAQKFQNKMEVYFVIYPSDNDVFKAFEEQMRTLQQKISQSSFTLAYEPRDEAPRTRAPNPQISLTSLSEEATREADLWLRDLLFMSSDRVTIRNNFILHFGEQEHQQLSRLSEKGVSIEESFVNGQASLTLRGLPNTDVVVAALQVEAMLCNIQREFVRDEEDAILGMTTRNVSFERKPVASSSQEFSDRSTPFIMARLRVLKVDKVENRTLSLLFDLKAMQLQGSRPQVMFQRVSAQFCEMIGKVGFHAECAPPGDPACGEGIYFADSVKKAMEVWKEPGMEYAHFVEAQVLTGKSTPGEAGLILPPPVGKDPRVMYDSVHGRGVSVIFSGYQALPKYIITCKVI